MKVGELIHWLDKWDHDLEVVAWDVFSPHDYKIVDVVLPDDDKEKIIYIVIEGL